MTESVRSSLMECICEAAVTVLGLNIQRQISSIYCSSWLPVTGEYTNMLDCKQCRIFSFAKNILKAGSNPLTEHFKTRTVGYSETKWDIWLCKYSSTIPENMICKGQLEITGGVEQRISRCSYVFHLIAFHIGKQCNIAGFGLFCKLKGFLKYILM